MVIDNLRWPMAPAVPGRGDRVVVLGGITGELWQTVAADHQLTTRTCDAVGCHGKVHE